MKKSVMLVDDHPAMLMALKSMLQDQLLFEVVGQCRNGEECLQNMKQINPGSFTNDDLHQELKNRGYHGFFNSKSSLPDAVAMFHPMPVHEEQELHPNDFKVASAKNHTLYDKALKTAQDTGHEDPHFLANLSTSIKNV
jgi:CheY-like chemotaxis protein